MEPALIRAISFAFQKDFIYWEFVCQIKSRDKQITQGILTVYHTLAEFAGWLWYAFLSCKLWNERKWHSDDQLNGNIMQTVAADALKQEAANAHASAKVLPLTPSFVFAEDAEFTNGAGTLCFDASHTKACILNSK